MTRHSDKNTKKKLKKTKRIHIKNFTCEILSLKMTPFFLVFWNHVTLKLDKIKKGGTKKTMIVTLFCPKFGRAIDRGWRLKLHFLGVQIKTIKKNFSYPASTHFYATSNNFFLN